MVVPRARLRLAAQGVSRVHPQGWPQMPYLVFGSDGAEGSPRRLSSPQCDPNPATFAPAMGLNNLNPRLAPTMKASGVDLARTRATNPGRGFGCRATTTGHMNLPCRALGVCIVLTAVLAASLHASTRKEEARGQFEKAEQMREALNGRPVGERTRRDYQRVAEAYRKVYYVEPASKL